MVKYLLAQAAAAGDRLPQAGAADGPQDRGADLQPAAVLAPARGGGHRHHRPLPGLLHDGLGAQGGHRGRREAPAPDQRPGQGGEADADHGCGKVAGGL